MRPVGPRRSRANFSPQPQQMLAPKILDLNGVVTENLKMLTRVIGEDIDLVMVPASGLGAVRADAGRSTGHQ